MLIVLTVQKCSVSCVWQGVCLRRRIGNAKIYSVWLLFSLKAG